MSSDLNKTDIEEDEQILENNKENVKNLDKSTNNQNEEKNEEEMKKIEMDDIKNEKEENIEFSKIIGNYLLFDQIGMGSFSKVTKAIHLITEQTVAVKILEKEKIEDDIDIERIIREIEILKTIMHPNIAQIYETYSTVHNIYLMMEYVEGGDLFDYITKNVYLSEPIACHIYRQIISVLDYLTEMGISHRDIKPENILLDESHKNIKIIDFGLSNYCKNKELLVSSCGSPCYASPEMLSGKPYRGVTTDLWSSGVVLYSMLVGSLPFDDQEIQKLYEQIKIGKFYLPSTLSLEAIDLLKKILEVNPKKRITLKQIKQHPWFNKVQNPLYKGIIYDINNINEFKFPYDNKVISFVIKEFYVDNKNINEEKLIDMIKKHEINQYTATYYIAKKNILKIEDNNFEVYSNTGKKNKILLKIENPNNSKDIKMEKHKKELSRNDKKEKENKRSNTEDNMIKNKDKNKNQKKNSKKKYILYSNNINRQVTQDIKDKNNIREDLKKDIPKLDLKNISIFANNPSITNNYTENTMREISPPNNLGNIYTLNSKNNNYNNPINTLKTEESQRNKYNNMNLYKDNKNNKIYTINNININKSKNKGIILSLSKADENALFDKDKNNKQNKSNGPIINKIDDELKIGHNLNRKKKANSHRKKHLNMIPKLNISNANIGNNNYKKNMNIHIMNYTSNNNNINNISKYNNPKIKNSFNFYNINKKINLVENKNIIFSYLKTDLSQNKEKHHQRNLSSGIKNQIQIKNNNNKILFSTKLGLLSKINANNIYNNKNNLSRNNNNYEMNMNRTKNTDFKKSIEKNHIIITPRTLEQKSTTNRIKNIDICQNFKGMINFKNSGNKNMNKININGINLNNINNMGNDNNSFGLNNNFINKCYLNRGNIINNNNNIILNIQNYYNRKNNKNETINLCKDNPNKK